MTTMDRELEDRKKIVAKFLGQVGEHDENNIFSNIDASQGYSNASDSQMDLSNAEDDSPRQDSTADDDSNQES